MCQDQSGQKKITNEKKEEKKEEVERSPP